MPRTSPEARNIFAAALRETGDYRHAARLAGIAERTGRRWRRDIHQAPADPRPSLADDLPIAPPSPSATRFEGRVTDFETLRTLFDAGERLVTVVGPPGIGKTRLALEWSARCRPLLFRCEAPVFCDLRGIPTRETFATEFAKALGVKIDDGEHFPEDALAAALAARGPCLILLDNFEELASEGAPAVARLLKRAPHCRFLITSRSLLKLQSEVAHELQPLSFPPEDASDTEWTESEALRLFWARATAAEPSLSLPDTSKTALYRVIHRLQGLPLALELAATQLRRVSIDQLDRELTDHLLTVEHLACDVDVRHRTLRAAIDHSFLGLTPTLQTTLAELSVFRGGFTVDAAHTISGKGQDIKTTTDRLAELRDRSLLRVVPDPSGRKRFDLLESIREYASGRLTTFGREHPARERHAAYALAEGERLVRRLRSPDGVAARAELQAELGNHTIAFDWLCAKSTGLEPCIRMALVLHAALVHWLPTRAIEVATRALGAGQRDQTRRNDATLRPRLLLARAAAKRDTGDNEGSARDLEDVDHFLATLPTPQSAEHCLLAAEAAFEGGCLARCRGKMDAAREALRDALARVEHLDGSAKTHLEGRIRSALGIVTVEGFRDEAGLAEHARAVLLLEQTGDIAEEAWARFFRASDLLVFERPPPLSELEEWAARLHRLGLHAQEANHYFVIGLVQHANGNNAEAERYVDRATRLMDRLGLARLSHCNAFTTGPLLEERNRLDEAGLCYERAALGFDRVGDPRFAALARIFLSGAVARHRDKGRAEALLAEANTLLETTGDRRWNELVALQHAHILLLCAREASLAGELSRAVTLRNDAQRLMNDAQTPRREGNLVLLPLARCSNEARKLLRILERTLDHDERASDRLTLTRDGSAFSLGGPSMRPVPEGPTLRSLLVALADHHTTAPGRALPTAQVIKTCWPDERIGGDAARHRVRALIYRLRQAGLGGVVITGARGGYLIDPAIPVDFVSGQEHSTDSTSSSGETA